MIVGNVLHVSELDGKFCHDVQIDFVALVGNALLAGVNSSGAISRSVTTLAGNRFRFYHGWLRLVFAPDLQRRLRFLVVDLVSMVGGGFDTSSDEYKFSL